MGEVFVVGVGASAGGVGALREFFKHVPREGGPAYVAILHLSPEYDSYLPEVLQADCPLPVAQVSDATRLEPNRVYVIAPNQSLTMADGYLTPSKMMRQEERRAPIDIFFRTLGDARGAYCACVILSGTGADGSVGIKRVKERGGLCLVQRPEEAEHPDMPRNAIATGLIDEALPVAQIPARVVAFLRTLGEVRVEGQSQRDADERAIRDIFSQLRVHTGHDFINYKRSTMWRRLERRLAVHGLPDASAYAQFLREHPAETQALLKDLLVSVTNFFRDREAFEKLERLVIPKLFERKTGDDHLRVWIAGCATGEEAYSIAMLLSERSSSAPGGPTIQVYATDIDDAAIAVAREALYGPTDLVDVSAERQRRFFNTEGDCFRIRKELREMVLFARHNVLKDPPFSHLDLVSCRNLLIYLNRTAQQRVLELLHFGLKPGGYLFLGQSESVEGTGNLFVSVDKDANIYQCREVPLRPLIGLRESVPAVPRTPASPEGTRATLPARERSSYAELHQRLLEEYAPPSIVVDEEYKMLHVSESAAQYLQFAGGEPSTNLLKAIRPELRLDLQTALYQARRQRIRVDAHNVRLSVGGESVAVNLAVRPVLRDGDTARGFFLVLFEPVRDGELSAAEDSAIVTSGDATLQLEEEVQRLRARLRATIEQHEIQSEELKASNEELQAMNEELRSTAEELETSKEELQSLNEELTTVNQELKIKIEEQAHATNDVQNLINTTEIAAVFLDRRARIKLFTPRARDIFHLIPSDRGRPLSDIHSPLEYAELHADIAGVLERLDRVQREVRTRDDRWYLMQVMPYRTSDDRIDGVVLTLIDVTEQKNTEARIQRNEAHLRSVLDSITDHALITIDAEGKILDWNVGAEQMFGFTAAEAVGQSTAIIFTPEDRHQRAHLQEIETAQTHGRAADERWHQQKDGSRLFVSGVLSPVGPPPAKMLVKVARDLTARKQSEEALQQSHTVLEGAVQERTAELRDLLNRLITVQEDERRRIARDLHDDIGQKMTALHLKLDALRRAHPPGSDVEKQVQQAQAFVQQLDRDLDFFTWELRPAALYDLGLSQALRDFVAEWSKNYGIAATFQAIGLGGERLRRDQEIHFYRIAQEALNNVHKHAQAKNVDVTLQRRDTSVVLTIEDDGIGLEPAGGDARGMGLINLRERAALMHGFVEFERPASGGTTVIVRAPIASPISQTDGCASG